MNLRSRPATTSLANSKQAFECWHQHLAEYCGTFQVEPPGSDHSGFHGQLCGLDNTAGVIDGARITTNSPHMFRTARDIRRDDKDFYYLVMQLQGASGVGHDERESMLEAGDMVLLDVTRPCDFHVSRFSDQVSLIFPRTMVQALGHSRQPLLNQPLRGTSVLGQLLGGMVRQVLCGAPHTAAESQAIQEAMLVLLRPVLNTREAADSPPRSRLTLLRAQAYIEQQIHEDNLTPQSIALAIGTSERSLFRQFSSHGLSIGTYILERRLECCARQLRESAGKISAIALGNGFRDLSHFSRSFRQRYGQSPSDYRRHHAGLSTG